MNDPLLELISGKQVKNLNRIDNIDDNISAIRSEFVDMPEVCHTLAGHIVQLRRNPTSKKHIQAFHELLGKYNGVIFSNYDIRWLLSICDTYVDIGDPLTNSIAMNIVQCINGCNLHTTLLVNVVDGRLDLSKLRQERKVPTFGGMITADVPSGDMIHNMMVRLDKVVEQHTMLNSIWNIIKQRCMEDGGVVMNHICDQSRFEHQKRFFK